MALAAGSVAHVARAEKMLSGEQPYDGILIELSWRKYPEMKIFREVVENHARDLFHRGELNSSLQELRRALRTYIDCGGKSAEIAQQLRDEIAEVRRAINKCR